ncbi:hypothetical protein [Cryobacterium sp. Y29]|uniref:hypothetical protein n=1 Tax=Cryobacterium sp. Y29 TaxID=2048285 RepID=UPI0011B09E29|nr:hypothetical protein [Cryobacterium sp. Y29]
MLTVVITFVVIIVARASAIRKLIMSTVGEFPYGTLLISLVSDFITLISVNAAGLRERRRLRYQLDPGFHRRNSRGGDQRRPHQTRANPRGVLPQHSRGKSFKIAEHARNAAPLARRQKL